MHCAQVFGYCMFKDEEEAKVNYPTEGFDGDVAGRSFHNGRFVQRLRQAAASMPSITIRQGIAKRLLNGARRSSNFVGIISAVSLLAGTLILAQAGAQ